MAHNMSAELEEKLERLVRELEYESVESLIEDAIDFALEADREYEAFRDQVLLGFEDIRAGRTEILTKESWDELVASVKEGAGISSSAQ